LKELKSCDLRRELKSRDIWLALHVAKAETAVSLAIILLVPTLASCPLTGTYYYHHSFGRFHTLAFRKRIWKIMNGASKLCRDGRSRGEI